MTDNYLFALIITFLLGLNFQHSFRGAAIKVGLVDTPCKRKNHECDIPLSGGIAMFLSFTFTALLLNDSIHNLRPLFSGLMILVVVGVLDDLHELKARTRFIMQLMAGFVAFQWGNVQLVDFGDLLAANKTLELRDFSLPMTLFAIVGITNAVNLLDGVDGLAGSISLLTIGILTIIAFLAGNISCFHILGLVCISILPFLFYNWRFYLNKKALVFMGDAGSLFLGFIIAYYFIKLSQGEDRCMVPVTALWIFAFPVIETITLIIRRLLQGRSPFSADREHFHHLLQAWGLSQPKTVLFILIISIVFAIIGLLGEYYPLPEHFMFYGFMLLFVAYFFAVRWAWIRFAQKNKDYVAQRRKDAKEKI
jgi:UDP-GlcNAc:undecaprenyl-phosphate GlcNAc-1-phosphate transferase